MKDQIKKLIADRKLRLSSFIFGQAKDFIDGKREKMANVDEAKEDNEETDEESLKKFDMVYVSGLAEIADGWYVNEKGEELLF